MYQIQIVQIFLKGPVYHLSFFVFNSFKSFIKIYMISMAVETNGILNKIQ